MLAERPFESPPALYRAAQRIWWRLGADDWLEGFRGHPQIGQRSGAAAGGAHGAERDAWSRDEQSRVEDAEADVKTRLAEANQRYLDQFGFIFIVCATGKSAAEMLVLLEQRLASDRAAELRTAAEEQAKITRLRLGKLLGALGGSST
jgi:OHCU decarboxylase